jgi:hypothetical protein
MNWVTREDVRIGRIACTWLIRTHIDPEADVAYVPGPEGAARIRQGAIPFHVKDVEFDHPCSVASSMARTPTTRSTTSPRVRGCGRSRKGSGRWIPGTTPRCSAPCCR